MKNTLLRQKQSTQLFSQNEVFFCPEESDFYSHCLEMMVLKHCTSSDLVVEFGTGDGSPVLKALLKTSFSSTIHGYELNASACQVANQRIQQHQLSSQYVIHPQSFFESALSDAEYLIANPPYLPAPDNQILMPLLHGGVDGATITKGLLELGYNNALLMISSYSNPIETIDHANEQGYCVANFMVTPLRFGYYSSEPKVKNTILELQTQQKAFFSDRIYFLAGVLFKKQQDCIADLSTELLQVMTSL